MPEDPDGGFRPWRGLSRARRELATLRDRVRGVRSAFEAISNDFAEGLLRGSPRYADPRKLNHHELTVHSQGGEDGILSEIFHRVGATDRRFVEIGIGDALQTNTTYRLELGWSGLWLEADEAYVERARRRLEDAVRGGRLDVRHAFVTVRNVSSLLRDAGVPPEFDLLSLDVDRNTWHLWDALEGFRPRVVVVEYNASIPPTDEWVLPYDENRTWDGSVRFGAGLKSYERLGREKGYRLVGCNLAGVNAFFVRSDLVGDAFADPFTAENHHEPPRYWLKWRIGHPVEPRSEEP